MGLMKTAILIIMLSTADGTHIHHVKHIDEGAYSYTHCLWLRDALLKTWRKRTDVTHLDIRCPNIWSET